MVFIMKIVSLWQNRHVRKFEKALAYFNSKSKNELLAEYFELGKALDRSSRSWELFLGLLVTIIFSDEVKHICTLFFSTVLDVEYDVIRGSMLVTLSIILFLGMLLFLILLSHINHSLLYRRRIILEYYLQQKNFLKD